jgi:NADPH:quinone reductase-like Zn-dependent oxidoreductase
LQALRDAGGIRPGQDVLIVGASGGVGIFGADRQGVRCRGDRVCGTGKIDLVRSLGADHIIDYTQEDLTATGPRYDLILDMGGNRSLAQLRRALRAGGTLVSVGSEHGNRLIGGRGWFQAILLYRFNRSLRPLASEPNHADLQVLAELIDI